MPAPEQSEHDPVSRPALAGLIVDWGGVLTGDLSATIERWATADGVDLEIYYAVIGEWLGRDWALEARMNPIHALERGELEVPDFEAHLAEEMSRRLGRRFQANGFVDRLFDHFEHAHDMRALVWRARQAGIRTALLSNSWGNTYPRDGWDDMFDTVVISGEVGMRKPDHEIYHYTVNALGLDHASCVFVDDLIPNVRAAVEVGMVGIHHQSYSRTAAEIDALFGLPLS